MKVLSCFALAASLLSIVSGCRKAELPDFVTAEEKNVMETNPCFPRFGKGGIGMTHDIYLCVGTKSKMNEIIWGLGENTKRWEGRKASKREVVVFFDGKVWPAQALPHDFDKSKSVVFSFEEKNIRFYDYVHKEGCYYERDPEN
ncbi:MAG: hypothetical protein WBQ94_26165 [Terracidiphilus sp.]